MDSKEFRNFRRKLGVSQKELGKMLGMCEKSISLAEIGKQKITLRTELALRYLVLEKGRELMSLVSERE